MGKGLDQRDVRRVRAVQYGEFLARVIVDGLGILKSELLGSRLTACGLCAAVLQLPGPFHDCRRGLVPKRLRPARDRFLAKQLDLVNA